MTPGAWIIIVVLLVVKAGSLAYEARLIRRKANANKRLRRELKEHGVRAVRPEQRAAALAIAFLRGKPFPEMNARDMPVWAKIEKMVRAYGIYDRREDEERSVEQAITDQTLRFDAWSLAASRAIKENVIAYEKLAPARSKRRAAHHGKTLAEWQDKQAIELVQ